MSTLKTSQPALSVYELVLLFDDHPTVGLIHAICEQIEPAPKSNRDLLYAMFRTPRIGALPEWFLDRLTDEQMRVIDHAWELWRAEGHT